MPFPISRRGTIQLPVDPRQPVAVVAAALEQALLAGEAAVVNRTGARISFETPLFGYPGRPTAPLSAITSGELEVVWRDGRHAVRYELRFTGLLLGTAILMVLMALMVGLASGSFGFGLFGSVLGWVWICGMSYGMASARFAKYLRTSPLPAEA